jgi:hypothetical protein
LKEQLNVEREECLFLAQQWRASLTQKLENKSKKGDLFTMLAKIY